MTSRHGFVDESSRGDTYLLTCTIVAATDLTAVSKALRSAVPTGQTRLHLSSEGAARRRQILRTIDSLPVRAVVFTTVKPTRGDDQPARDRCLSALVRLAAEETIDVLTLDTRDHERDRRDRARLGLDLAAAGLSDHVAYSHRGSRDELLIALPDAIGWAIGKRKPWSDMIATVVGGVRPVPDAG